MSSNTNMGKSLLRSSSILALSGLVLSGCSMSVGSTSPLKNSPGRLSMVSGLANLTAPSAEAIAKVRQINNSGSRIQRDEFNFTDIATVTRGYATRVTRVSSSVSTAPLRFASNSEEQVILASATVMPAAQADGAASTGTTTNAYANRIKRVSKKINQKNSDSKDAAIAIQETPRNPARRRPSLRRPGRRTIEQFDVPLNEGAVPPPTSDQLNDAIVPVPDRWRLAANLGVVKASLINPYAQNTLKGDRPLKGTEDWFFAGSLISDTIIEPRSFPVPISPQTSERAGTLDVFGDNDTFLFSQTIIAQAALIKGLTAYKPQDLEFRITAAFNFNYAEVEEKRILFVKPSKGITRNDGWIGIQEAFIDYHIRNVSDRYDFDSLRIGIQPFSSDFRGFLFQDNQLGIRFFGNRDNNRWQYNLAGFMRLEKDTNSGLNDVTVTPREDYVLLANAYRQDFPVPGMTSQGTFAYNINREKNDIQIDDNGFPVRPATFGDGRTREYDVAYLGYNADGRWGRLNLTASAYYAFGENRNSVFTGNPADIKAFFLAAEPSIDYNWIRFRLSGLYASGDKDPYDDEENGFDAIFENPQFAGADTSYYIRQTIPFAGGGRAVSLNNRNGILNALRPSKEQGQSNFANPGTILLGAGVDLDVSPQLRISSSVNHLWFDDTSTLQVLRNQGPSTLDNDIGWDVSVSAIYRPKFIQNFVFRLSGATLLPGDGFEGLFTNNEHEDYYYSVLFNGTISY